MWPQALQMSRDECRGILRRLELESYSNVISVFRAQGGLTENKAKLLEELRGIFHISQERHRAEARRVANDEQLCTIAEAISGPNTWQEWSREGRRSYPMLPRVAPQTALALIANNVAKETATENANLPYPADTAAAAIAAEHANTLSAIAGRESVEKAAWETKRDAYVVTEDPFKMPDIPSSSKKNLKRNISDSHTGSNKKRIVSDTSPIKQQQQQQQKQKQFHHITANSAQPTSPNMGSNIQKLYHNHNSKAAQNRINQMQQVQPKQKLATKKSAASAGAGSTGTVMPGTPGKRQATPAKSGRKSNLKLQEQKQLQLLQQQQHQEQQLAQSQQQLLPQTGLRSLQHIVGEGIDESYNETKYAQPLIAASKKDITKNLTKLQLPSVITSPTPMATAVSPTVLTSSMVSHTPSPSATSMNVLVSSSTRIDAPTSSNMSGVSLGGVGVNMPISPMIHNKTEKQLISTPVQKIILEDRLPPQLSSSSTTASVGTSVASAIVVSTASTFTQLQSTTTTPPQIMTLPQITAAATKLRAINTTILPPGTKLTTKKLTNAALLNTSAGGSNESNTILPSQTQVFSFIEANNANNINNNSSASNIQTSLAGPTHTPPAIIQLQSANNINENVMATTATTTITSSSSLPVQGKVLTTKLPVTLGGGATVAGGANVSSGGNTVNITKIETLNNGATLVGGAGGGCLSSNSNTLVGGTTTVVKNMGSTLLLSPNQTVGSSGNALFSTLTSGASVFRKSQFIKTGAIGISTSNTGKISGTFTSSNSGPQIISNIKLTPANTNTNISTISQTNQQNQQPTTAPFLQHQLKNISRTNVKISNGKVFIQSGATDGSSKGKLHSTLSHKILPKAVVSSGAGTSSQHQPPRVAIQNIQIIPAPLNSPGNLTANPFHTATSQSQTTRSASNTNTGGKKGNMNMVFVPSAGVRTTAGTITLAKNSGGSTVAATNKVQQTAQSSDTVKPNVVIIGASTAKSTINTPIKATTFFDNSNKYNLNTPISVGISNTIRSQMITEDTPVDILNMPIIVDSGDGTNITMGNNIGDTVTVLPTSLVESATQSQQQQPSTIILGATDWEMELDQATAVAAATKAAARSVCRRQASDNISGTDKQQKQQQQHQDKESIDGETIIIDDSFEDVIVEEQEDGDTDVGAETDGTVDGEAVGEGTGGEEGQEISEKAYTIFSGNESEGEALMAKQRETTVKLKVGRMQKPFNNNTNPSTTSAAVVAAVLSNDDSEPIEVIDDDDENEREEKRKKAQPAATITSVGDHKAQKGNENKFEKKINATNEHNEEGGNANTTGIECETDAGFDETIVADIDENTAIEYIEEDINTQLTHAVAKVDKVEEQCNIGAATKKATKIQSEVIVLGDNDAAPASPTSTLIIAAARTKLVTTPLSEATTTTLISQSKTQVDAVDDVGETGSSIAASCNLLTLNADKIENVSKTVINNNGSENIISPQ
ncbi:BRCA2-interacting transcriptional repressor EMSY [Eurosta solidaginis]|uniref:BRCA2-interacting transcriptional repressor EMSY n=1 Tax=Eurosta solidaginis TaxID=178769 RepID=UPI003531484C